MRLVKRAAVIAIMISSLGLAACGGDDSSSGDDDGGQMIDPNGTHHTYVLDSVKVPSNTNEANQVAVDVDGDGRTENAIGGLLAALISAGNLDLQAQVDAQIQAGGVIILADMQATDLTNATGVGLRVYLGDTASVTPAPCSNPDDPSTCGQHLTGDGMFQIAADSPQNAVVIGQNVSGQFTGGPGNITIELALSGGAPLKLTLIGARVKAGVSDSGLSSGVLGGAVTVDDVNNNIIPAVADLIAGILVDSGCDANADPCCPDGSTGASVLSFLDTNGDCMIPAEELQSNQLIQSTLETPDLDLLDADGNYNPNQDMVKDSVSLGVGFSAVSGAFDTP